MFISYLALKGYEICLQYAKDVREWYKINFTAACPVYDWLYNSIRIKSSPIGQCGRTLSINQVSFFYSTQPTVHWILTTDDWPLHTISPFPLLKCSFNSYYCTIAVKMLQLQLYYIKIKWIDIFFFFYFLVVFYPNPV